MKPGLSWTGSKRPRKSCANEKAGWGLPLLASGWISGSVDQGNLRVHERSLILMCRRSGVRALLTGAGLPSCPAARPVPRPPNPRPQKPTPGGNPPALPARVCWGFGPLSRGVLPGWTSLGPRMASCAKPWAVPRPSKICWPSTAGAHRNAKFCHSLPRGRDPARRPRSGSARPSPAWVRPLSNSCALAKPTWSWVTSTESVSAVLPNCASPGSLRPIPG